MDEKPEAPDPLPDCEERNQTALDPEGTTQESNKEYPPPEAEKTQEIEEAEEHPPEAQSESSDGDVDGTRRGERWR
jgi:hypothetical protein